MPKYQACKCCLSSNGQLLKCSSCKEALYCGREHQQRDWKTHKKLCKAVQLNPESVFVELPPNGAGPVSSLLELLTGGLGGGLTSGPPSGSFQDRMVDHVFPNKQAGLDYVAGLPDFADDHISLPYPSLWAKHLSWEVEIYISGRSNALDEKGNYMIPHMDMVNLNHAGIILASTISREGLTSQSLLKSVHGTIFVTGRSLRDGHPFTSRQLSGVVAFLQQYQHETNPFTILHAKNQFLNHSWQPDPAQVSGFEHIDIYASDVRTCRDVIDHTVEDA